MLGSILQFRKICINSFKTLRVISLKINRGDWNRPRHTCYQNASAVHRSISSRCTTSSRTNPGQQRKPRLG